MNQQKGENDRRKYFMIKSPQKNVATRWGLNPLSPDYQPDALPTEPSRPAGEWVANRVDTDKVQKNAASDLGL